MGWKPSPKFEDYEVATILDRVRLKAKNGERPGPIIRPTQCGRGRTWYQLGEVKAEIESIRGYY